MSVCICVRLRDFMCVFLLTYSREADSRGCGVKKGRVRKSAYKSVRISIPVVAECNYKPCTTWKFATPSSVSGIIAEGDGGN